MKAFLRLPTSCGAAQRFEIAQTSWEGVESSAGVLSHGASGAAEGYGGCAKLPFAPTVSVTPETSVAETPTGLVVDVHVPQPEAVVPVIESGGEPTLGCRDRSGGGRPQRRRRHAAGRRGD